MRHLRLSPAFFGLMVGSWISLATHLHAKVIDSTASGFTITHEAVLDASPYQVYEYFVNDISKWWNGSHSFSGNAANLKLDAAAGGCLCERWSGSKWVEHLRVVQVQPHQILVMRGALGPLQSMAVSGSMTIDFTTTETGKTRVRWVYTVGGYRPGGLQALAGPVDGVIGEQLRRLVRYVGEKG